MTETDPLLLFTWIASDDTELAGIKIKMSELITP